MRVTLARSRHFLIILCFILAACSVAKCQTDPLQARNPIPWGSYQDSQVDTVNLMNGSLILHMPLYSLPQRGQLSLTFSLKGTSPAYGFGTYTCTANNGLGPCYTGGFTWNNKPTLVLDQALWGTVTQYRYPANSNTFYNVYSITDSIGTIHELGYDNSNRQLLRATDGTGFLFNPALTPPYNPFISNWGSGTIYTPSGIQHIHGTSNYTIRDADGNSIAMAMNCCFITQITDSVGRTIPLPPTSAASSSTTGCPAVTALYQATTGSSTWIVPGPNGAQLTFLLCYASIYVHTDFFGGCINTNNNCNGNYDSCPDVY